MGKNPGRRPGLPAAAARTVGNTMNTAMSAAGRVTDQLLYPGG